MRTETGERNETMAEKAQNTGAGRTQQPDSSQTREPAEKLRDRHGTSRALFAGACAANGWRAGKALTEKEFLDGIAAFAGAPADGSGKRGGTGRC